MHLAYLDESYNDRYYWLGALVVPERGLRPITEELDQVVADVRTTYGGISESAELHGHDLFHGSAEWDAFKLMPRVRVGVYAKVLRVLAQNDVHVLLRGVDRKRLVRRYYWPDHPHSVALEHLLERVDECAEHELGGDPMLVIADEIDQADRYRRHLWHFQRHATGGYRARRLEFIVDTIHFAPSRASRLLQAADMVVYLHQRIFNRRLLRSAPDRADRANERLWDIINPRIHHSHCWYP